MYASKSARTKWSWIRAKIYLGPRFTFTIFSQGFRAITIFKHFLMFLFILIEYLFRCRKCFKVFNNIWPWGIWFGIHRVFSVDFVCVTCVVSIVKPLCHSRDQSMKRQSIFINRLQKLMTHEATQNARRKRKLITNEYLVGQLTLKYTKIGRECNTEK